MKKLLRNKVVIFSLFTVIFLILVRLNYIDISSLSDKSRTDIHFNLITVNSIFAGFLFSALSLIIGLANSKTVIRMERAGFMSDIYKNIVNGIVFSLCSITVSLVNIFITPCIINQCKIYFLVQVFKYFLPSIELTLLITAIECFILAVIDMTFIIKSVRRKMLNDLPNREEIKKTLDKIE